MLTAIGPRVRRNGRTYNVYRCTCGNVKELLEYNVKGGKTVSCGCVRRANAKRMGEAHRTKHGMYGTPTYISWSAMLTRCENTRAANYANYGGRGITVCPEWHKFDNFYADMGERPIGTSIERIDVNGNYEPRNCRWATYSEQRTNQRRMYGQQQM